MLENCDVVIPCGGRGTRLYPVTETIPKAMVPIGGMPILEHVLRLYMGFGFRRFKLLLGYKGEVIRRYFNENHLDVTIDFVDTGIDTGTADRIWQVRNDVSSPFLFSYCDVLADLDFDALVRFHQRCGKPATMTVTALPSSYGVVDVDEDFVANHYEEKPILKNTWINAGFFVLNELIFENWSWTDADFSRSVIPLLVEHRMLACYRHVGFWSTMDTEKEHAMLEGMWNSGKPTWVIRRQT